MSIIFKFTLRNIKEKKLRTFLILLSIIMSSALFFASTAVSTTVEMIIMEQCKILRQCRYYSDCREQAKSWAIFKLLITPRRVKYAVGMIHGVENMGKVRLYDRNTRHNLEDLR